MQEEGESLETPRDFNAPQEETNNFKVRTWNLNLVFFPPILMCRNIRAQAYIQAQQNLSLNFRTMAKSVQKKDPNLGMAPNTEPNSLVCCNQVSFKDKINSIATSKRTKLKFGFKKTCYNWASLGPERSSIATKKKNQAPTWLQKWSQALALLLQPNFFWCWKKFGKSLVKAPIFFCNRTSFNAERSSNTKKNGWDLTRLQKWNQTRT